MPGHALCAQANARASRVECAVRGLRLDELEVASLRGEVCTLALLWYFVLLVKLLQHCHAHSLSKALRVVSSSSN